MEQSYGFIREIQRKAKDYLFSGLRVSLCKWLIILILAFLVLDLELSNTLESLVRSFSSEPSFIVALYTLFGYGIFWFVSLPFDYYRGYVLEHRFELSTENVSGWFRSKIKASVLSLLLILLLVEGIYNFMWLNPTYWWMFLWVATAFAAAFLLYISPVLIMPLFFKFPKLEDKELLNRLTKLANKAGIKIIGVFEMKAEVKTKKAIAALTGIGNTRRMLLSDTFLSNYTNDEIESVMGHEIGHHIFGHIWKSTIMLSAALLLILFISHLTLQNISLFFNVHMDSVASLPLFALTFGLLFMAFIPVMNTLSRRAEGNCDQYELELVGKPEAYISSMIKLCDQNLRYACPSPLIEFLLYDHPSGKNRVERALAYKRRVQ